MMGLGFRHTKLDSATREMVPLTKADLANFSAPTLVFYGEKDNLSDAQKGVARAKEVIPNLVAAEIVPGQGDFLGKEAQSQVSGGSLAIL
jgi:pimeloyl-ACP methyl ester carboxylesterase